MTERAQTPVIEVDRLCVDLAGRRVLDDVSFAAGRGELVGLLGPNGAGKTTLIRSILRLIPAVSGTVRIGGDASAKARQRVGYVPQRQEFAWDFPISVLDAVVLGRVKTIGWLRRPGVKDYEAAIAALNRTGMKAFQDRPVGDLSGGQRQRVLVARALALEPHVMLLDEPFTGLDMPTQELLTELFHNLAAEGETLIMSTHDIAGAVDACSRILLLNRRVVADGAPAELNNHELWCSTFSISPDNPLLTLVDHAAHSRSTVQEPAKQDQMTWDFATSKQEPSKRESVKRGSLKHAVPEQEPAAEGQTPEEPLFRQEGR